MAKEKKKKYTAISLFSGAMGLDAGLIRTSRFKLLACVEKEKVFCDTIRANIENGTLAEKPFIYEIDIKKLEPNQLLNDLGIREGEIDFLVGGPPCQSFSTAGKRGTVQDTRGTLLWDFMRFVKVLKPKVFLMENVRGLMSAALRHRPLAKRPDKGGPPLATDEMPGSVVNLFAKELLEFSEAPYHLDCFEVNAVNYGAPQLRERILFIGNRYNCEIDFAKPTHGPNLLPWRTIGDVLKSFKENEPTIMDFSPRKKKFLSLVPPGGNWRYLPEVIQKESMGKAYYAKGGRSGWWRKLSYDLPCPTLVTMPNHASTALCHPDQVRALSVREYCRIQEFPDEWVVCGSPAQQYAQIGNAVPVKLGEIAGNVIVTFLDSLAKSRWCIKAQKPSEFRRIYIQSHVRTRHWFKEGKACLWLDGIENSDVIYSDPKIKYSTSSLSVSSDKKYV